MNALRLTLYACLILTTISLSWQKEKKLEPTGDICRLFANGTELRKPGSCDESVICQNFVSTPGQQCAKWYSIDSSSCVTKMPSDDYCKSPCLKTSPKFVADKKNCYGWYQCNGSIEVSKGSCPSNQLFNPKQQACSYEDVNCVLSYDFCDVVPKDTAFKDEMNCHKYYKCDKKGLHVLSCDLGKYFDKALGVCTPKAQVDCYKHPYPDNVCGDTKIAYRNRFVDDRATCRGYFYCKDLGVGVPDKAPRWGQCSVYEFFNPIEQACQLRSHVKCLEDRCDGRLMGEKELSGKKGCQHYLECGNNYTISEKYCGDGLYFNADLSICTSERKSYGACA